MIIPGGHNLHLNLLYTRWGQNRVELRCSTTIWIFPNDVDLNRHLREFRIDSPEIEMLQHHREERIIFTVMSRIQVEDKPVVVCHQFLSFDSLQMLETHHF